MEFEVAPAVVDASPARRRRGVAAVLIGFGAVVGIALTTVGPPRAGQAETVRAEPSPSLAIARGAESDGPTFPRTIPAELHCRDVDRGTCQRMATAALRALPDDAPAVLAATVWRSLLCGDTFDCPPAYLDGSTPLGSVTVRFADGSPQAAINVVDGRPGPIQRAPRAWIVRWMPETGLSALVLAGLRQETP
jgi:hypothetical protein